MASTSGMAIGACLVAALGVGGYFLFSSGTSPDDYTSVGFEAEDLQDVDDGDAELDAIEQAADEVAERFEGEAGARESVEAEVPGGPEAQLVLVGRVVTGSGSPVVDADVSLFLRRDLESFFREGGGRFFRNRGARRNRSLMDSFRLKRVAKTVKTANDGKFRFEGPAFAKSNLEIGVTHSRFAPKTTRRDWNVETGELDIGDIQVENGAIVIGRVITSAGAPLEAAKIRWEPQEESRRGGRGGRGGRGRRGRFGGPSPLEQLIGQAESDARGMFQLGPIPQGDFKLAAEADGYLPGETKKISVESKVRVDAGTLTLTMGSKITGLVVDENKQPIANARVRGSASREAERRAREQRDANRQRRGGQSQNARAPQVLRAAEGGSGRRVTRETKTDAKGRFTLDALPLGELRISVEHEKFISETKDPVDPKKQLRVEVQMVPRIAITGQVVDARTGEPITNYGIVQRRSWGGFGRSPFGDRGGRGGRGDRGGRGGRGDRGNRGDRGGRRGERGNRSEEQDAEARAREAERDARRRQEEQYRISRFGPSGQAPQRNPKPTAHADGEFTLNGLEPGTWMLDVSAPGYARLADGPIEIERGKAVSPRKIRLVRSSVLTGVVTSNATKKPLRRASVEVFVPPLPGASDNDDNPWRRMFARGSNNGTRVERGTTDKDGRFRFEGLRGGNYRVVINAKDHVTETIDRVTLAASKTTTSNVVLGVGGTLTGKVRGFENGMRLRIRNAENDSRRVDVKQDGSYRVAGLAPGGWFVTVEESGGGFRRGGASMFRQLMGNATPDVFLKENVVTRYDVDAQKDATAKVEGTVRINGMPSEGVELSLRVREQPGATQDATRSMIGRFAGRLLRDSTDESGAYSIDNVPAGDWTIRVSKGGSENGRGRGGFGRRGGGGDGRTIASFDFSVVAGQTFQKDFEIRIGGLELDLQNGKGKAVENARVSIALATEAAGKEPSTWRELPSYRRLRVQKGIAKASDLSQGRWSYAVTGSGVTTKVGTLYVGAGSPPVELIELEVDEAAAAAAAKEREERRAKREAERNARPANERGGNRNGTNRRGGGGRNPGGRR